MAEEAAAEESTAMVLSNGSSSSSSGDGVGGGLNGVDYKTLASDFMELPDKKAHPEYVIPPTV